MVQASDAKDAPRPSDILAAVQSTKVQARNKRKELDFRKSHGLLIGFLTLVITLHAIGIFLFTNGFLLSRLVLDDRSGCSKPPIDLYGSHTPGSPDQGCWHPRSFNKAVILIIDALRFDFTVPPLASDGHAAPHYYQNSIPTLYETSVQSPGNAFLRPFIADPPTTTLQRLKGLTTGSLPTFIDAGSNFAGTTIAEDNLITQLNNAGKKVVHLGDDTWHALFPGEFEPNLTKAFDSFNVPDLHTVDNGVITNLFPLLDTSMAGRWDVVIGHFLGVDHVGHNFGPDHPTMTTKLKQMDDVIRRTMRTLDEDTLLVIMGDHGMDSKGNHGGESDDEVEAALWMYSKARKFGRSEVEYLTPPQNAKERPVAQIDLVPTLALLLGLPIPANNLGTPIEEAFIGTDGQNWQNMALVNRLAAAQARRFQEQYVRVRKLDEDSTALADILWGVAGRDWDTRMSSGKKLSVDQWRNLAGAFSTYQQQNLDMFRGLWSTFNVVSMSMGVTVLLFALAIIVVYVTSSGDNTSLHYHLCVRGAGALVVGLFIGGVVGAAMPLVGRLRLPAFLGAFSAAVAMLFTLRGTKWRLSALLPKNVWSWMCSIFVLLLAAGFASNSFTVWEEEHLLYILIAFCTVMLVAAYRLTENNERIVAAYHAITIMVMLRIASCSRVCREEQMPNCTPLFYASATSTTSAGWRLAIPWVIGIVLPASIKAYYDRTYSYQASASLWIGIAFRTALFLVAAIWTLDTAGAADLNWFSSISPETLKVVRTYLAQLVLCISVGAGGATFGYQGPMVGIDQIIPGRSISERESTDMTTKKAKANGTTNPPTAEEPVRPRIVVQGTTNMFGSHFGTLPFTVLLMPLILLSKPMGQLALFCTTITIFSLLELLHLLRLTPFPANITKFDAKADSEESSSSVSPLGPTILALLAHFTYFKTGHQAALASIQWDTAFVPLQTIRYPWSPLFVILNTFSGQILCAAAVPLVVLWRRKFSFNSAAAEGRVYDRNAAVSAKERAALLSDVAKAQLMHFLVYAVIQLATTLFAAHLRRHLMLYRVFCPRWMLASVGMIVAEVASTFIGVLGVGVSVGAVGGLFGW